MTQFRGRVLGEHSPGQWFTALEAPSFVVSCIEVESLQFRSFAKHSEALCTGVSFAGLIGKIAQRANVLAGLAERHHWGCLGNEVERFPEAAPNGDFGGVSSLTLHNWPMASYGEISSNSTDGQMPAVARQCGSPEPGMIMTIIKLENCLRPARCAGEIGGRETFRIRNCR